MMGDYNYDEALQEWLESYRRTMREHRVPADIVQERAVGAVRGWKALQAIVESNAWAEATKPEVVPVTTGETATERALIKTIGILSDHIDMLEGKANVPLTEHLRVAEG